MLFGRYRSWLVVGLALLLSTPHALAQSWPDQHSQPAYPNVSTAIGGGLHSGGGAPQGGGLYGDYAPQNYVPQNYAPQNAAQGYATQSYVAQTGCPGCGVSGCLGVNCGPNNGWFFQWDRLYWAIEAPDTVAIGSRAAERFITPPGGTPFFHRNDLDTGFFETEFKTGDRFDFGRMDGSHGWSMSIFQIKNNQFFTAGGVNFVPNDPDSLLFGFFDGNNDGFDDDLDLDQIHGRDGQDLGTPAGGGGFVIPFDGIPDVPAATDFDDGVDWLVIFNSMTVRNEISQTGFDLMGIYRDPNSSWWGTLEYSYGLRYIKIKDRFDIRGDGGFLDAMDINTVSDNDLIGPQVGIRWTRRCGYFRLALEGRFMAGYNYQRTDQTGSVATNAAFGGTNGPLALAPSAFRHRLTNEEFAPVVEFRADTIYKINRCVAFRIGYTGLLTDGISRASGKVNYTIPNFGINDVNSSETIFNNALTFGVEFNR